ncbi:MAG: sulfate transporter, partial [Clostridia bacterium]
HPPKKSIASIAAESLGYFAQPIRILRSYRHEYLRYDLIAALSVAVILLPQSIVYAFIAGMPPAAGLYTAIVGTIIAALWGSSQQAQSGPTNTHALLTLSVAMTVATVGTPEYLSVVALLALMVGAFKLTIGITRLGVLANFVSDAVIVGFTAGAGILIAINQLPHLMGLHLPHSSNLMETISQMLHHMNEVHLPSLALGLLVLVIVVALTKINRKIPGPFIAMILAGALVGIFHLDQLGVSVVGELPRGLPPLAKIPITDWQLIGRLSTGALAVGAIGLVQTTSVTRSLASMTGQRLDTNQEFVAQGLANIGAGLFSGFLVTSSFNRSALNLQSGARTQLAAIFTGLIVLIAMLILAPYAALLPGTALAGVLLVIASRMVDRQEISRILHAGRGDAIVMIVTLVFSLILPLESAVIAGILLSLGHYILRTSTPQVIPVLPDDSFKHLVPRPDKPQCPQLAVIEVQGDLYFGAISHIEETILENKRKHPQQLFLLLRMQNVQVIDISGIHMLEALLNTYREAGGDVYLVKVHSHIAQHMEELDFVDKLGSDHFLEEDTAISHLFYHVLDPAVCIYECDTRAFSECQNLPRPTEHITLPHIDISSAEAIPTISVEALAKALQGPAPPVVLDIREPREYKRSHIPQAQNLPFSKIISQPPEAPSDRPVVLVGRTSRRSRRVAQYLQKRGYDNISILEGGLQAWENADLLTAVDFS